jgi:hypothetical protein
MEAEVTAIITDSSKQITQNIDWALRNGVGPWASFEAPVHSDTGWPLLIKGGFNANSRKLHFALILQGRGRIYGLCLGNGHTNLDRQRVDSPHKHCLTDVDLHFAYSPSDITAQADEPLIVWQQFCMETLIRHVGILSNPPPLQMDFL